MFVEFVVCHEITKSPLNPIVRLACGTAANFCPLAKSIIDPDGKRMMAAVPAPSVVVTVEVIV